MNRYFTISALSKELNICTTAKNSSRKKAEQSAAGEMIKLLAKQGFT